MANLILGVGCIVKDDNFLISQSQKSLRADLIFQFTGIQFSFLLKLLTLKSHPRNGQFKSTTKRCLILDALIDRVQMGADLHGHQWAPMGTDGHLWAQVITSAELRGPWSDPVPKMSKGSHCV